MMFDIGTMPFPWFGVSFWADNVEKAVRLDKVQSLHANWIYKSEDYSFWLINLTLDNGKEVELSLTNAGYDALLEALVALQIPSVIRQN